MSEPRAPYDADLFGDPTPDDVSLADQIACVKREIAMRERAYPRWVESERMTQAQADRELLSMRAVLETLSRQGGALDLLRNSFDHEEMRYDVQAVNQAHRVLMGEMVPRGTVCDQDVDL